MNKYRIKIDVHGSQAAFYDAYATSASHAAMLALALGHDLAAVDDEVKLNVILTKVNLNRKHAACKRVQ